MSQASNAVAETWETRVGPELVIGRVRLPAPVILGRLKAERIEQPLSAAKVLEAMAGLPGWGLSPKGIRLARVFHFPGNDEARAFSDYLLHLGLGLRIQMRVTVENDRVHVVLKGRKGGIPPYLLDFAALLSQ